MNPLLIERLSMTTQQAQTIRERIKAFKRDSDLAVEWEHMIASYNWSINWTHISKNRDIRRKLAEYGYAYDEMLRGEYAEV
jgi:hypothetical protein